ncbi:MAG TPA: response regulator [Nitrososphaeraceae archaeon]|nr:response regulator [Nitrososphaeraceae archaeon]
MGIAKPRVFIVQENEDANVVLTGTLWEKGFESFRFTNGTECLVKFNEMEGKVDAIVVSGIIAVDRNLMLITRIKKINKNTKVFVIADNDLDKKEILSYGADEFGTKPTSPENIADQLFISLSREVVTENR